MIDTSAAERRYIGDSNDYVPPLWGCVVPDALIPRLAPWATDLPPLRGYNEAAISRKDAKARRREAAQRQTKNEPFGNRFKLQ